MTKSASFSIGFFLLFAMVCPGDVVTLKSGKKAECRVVGFKDEVFTIQLTNGILKKADVQNVESIVFAAPGPCVAEKESVEKATVEKVAVQNAKTKAWETAVLVCKGKPWSFLTEKALESQGYGKAEILTGNNRWYMLYYPKGDFTIVVDKSKNDTVRYVFKGKHTELPPW